MFKKKPDNKEQIEGLRNTIRHQNATITDLRSTVRRQDAEITRLKMLMEKDQKVNQEALNAYRKLLKAHEDAAKAKITTMSALHRNNMELRSNLRFYEQLANAGITVDDLLLNNTIH